MGELRKPLFIIAAVLLSLAVLTELGSSLIQRLSQTITHTGSQIDPGALSLPPLQGVSQQELNAKLATNAGTRPPGMAIFNMALLDGLVLFTVALVGTSLFVPERIQGRVQGVVTLIVSVAVLFAAILRIGITLASLMLMVTLFLAVPFGTIIYLIGYGSFDTGLAKVLLSTIMTFKFGFAGCLAFAHPGFLKMKGLVLIVLFSLAAGIVVSFLQGLVPPILVSITDAVAGIVVAIFGALWAVFFLIGSIPSIVKSIKLKA